MRAGGACRKEGGTSEQMKSSRDDWPAFGEAPGERPLPLPLPRPLEPREVAEDLGEEGGGRPFGLAGRGAEPFDLDLVRATDLEVDLVEGGTEARLWTAGERFRKESATPPSQERAPVEKN